MPDPNEMGSTPESVLEDTPQNEQPIATKPKKFGLTKYTVYVTSRRMYVVGSNTRETVFRILEIDLTSPEKLIIMEDNVYFSRTEIMDVLNGLEESSVGGLTKKITAVGLLGFIRFTKYFYLLVVTKRRPVAILGGHYLFHIEGTELIPVTSHPRKAARNSEEARYLQTFCSIDLCKTFYFSYNYDLTNTLQVNFLRYKTRSLGLYETDTVFDYNDRFVWNSHLLDPVLSTFDRVYDWFQPVIHGFVDQVKVSIFDAEVYITLIARRSHHFAGARFFKRGVNDSGNVANEVETEQIVTDLLTTSFHDSASGFFNNPRYTSFVQHRGSIPLSWSQATAPNIRMPKPPIELNVIDPFYSAAALHFDNLFKRYGAPVQILNLIKQKEKTARETKLLTEFENCVNYLNLFLPESKKIEYTAWDMSRASKSRGQDVIAWLENYSEHTVSTTGFFHNGRTLAETQLQEGVCRTNCIDCLDRTNTAQFVIGKRALGHQLYALGYIKKKYLEYDSDAINIWTEMFHDHGDTIALQYGGSHLVNTLQTYRKINQWSSHSRDMVESVKRFYSNSFMDAQRQDAINLFLGNYVYKEGHPMLWDLNTDYYLHNNYVDVSLNRRPSYTHWYSDCNLEDQKLQLRTLEREAKGDFYMDVERLVPLKIDAFAGFYDNYWNTKYPPRELSSFSELFEFNMNSTMRYSSVGNNEGGKEKEKEKDKDGDELASVNMAVVPSGSSSTGGSDSSGFKYISPFKSKKPHRERRLEQGFQSDDEGSICSTEDVAPKRPSFASSGLLFSESERKKFGRAQDNLRRTLLSADSEIARSIKDSRMLPIIFGSNAAANTEETFMDETYFASVKEPPETNLNGTLRRRYFDDPPSLTPENLEKYSKAVETAKTYQIVRLESPQGAVQNSLRNEYAALLQTSLADTDLNLYQQFAGKTHEEPKLKSASRRISAPYSPERLNDAQSGYRRNSMSALHTSSDPAYFSFKYPNDKQISIASSPIQPTLSVETAIAESSSSLVGGLHNEDLMNSPFSHTST